MVICDEAWETFMLYADAIMKGSKDYNKDYKGSVVIGNKDADIFDVFNFWRENFLDGNPYSKKYLDGIVQQAIMEEPYGA